MLGAEPGDQAARPRRADLLVGIDEHGKGAVLLEIHRFENSQCVQDHRDSLFVVGDAQAVGAIAFDAEGLLGEHAARVNRVHVRDQQDFLCPLACERCPHHLADFFGCVCHFVNIARFHQLDLAA